MLFSTLALPVELFNNYFTTNLYTEETDIIAYLSAVFVFVCWYGVLYALTDLTYLLYRMKVSFLHKLIYSMAIFIAGFLHLTKIIHYVVDNDLIYFCQGKISLLIPPLFIILLLSYVVFFFKPDKDSFMNNGTGLFQLLLPGFLLYTASTIIKFSHSFSNLPVLICRLYLIIVVFIWIKKYYIKTEPFAAVYSDEELIRLIVNKFSLTNRESEILVLLIDGKNSKEIEQALFISASTIRNHISAVYAKLGINSRGQLMNLVLKMQKGEN